MKRFVLYLVIVVAFLTQMRVVVPSGSHYCAKEICGYFYWGAHEHDGIWHLALINTAFGAWPPQLPNFAGLPLSGYNALLDATLYTFKQLTYIDSQFLYFKIMPIIWFIMMVKIWLKFGKIYSKNESYGTWLLFFLFFGNSFSYILRLWHEGQINGASGLLAMQSPQMLTNIQFALSLPLLGMALYIIKVRSGNNIDVWKLAIITFITMALKFYGGVILLIMTSVYSLTLFSKKTWRQTLFYLILPIIGFTSAIVIFYNPLAGTADPIFRFSPMATVHPLIEEIGLVYLPKIASARNNLITEGVGIKLIVIEMFTLGLFLILNFGTRIFGFMSIIRGLTRDKFHYVTFAGMISGILLNIFLVQRGEWWNTVQFLYYAMIIMNVYVAEWASNLGKHNSWATKLTLCFVIILTLPNAIDTGKIFGSFPPGSYISDDEIRVLSELKKQDRGTVLALPYFPSHGESTVPAPLYSRYDTAYVSALSGQQTYINDQVQLRLTGIAYLTRENKVLRNDCEVLKEVKYVYVSRDIFIDPWLICSKKLKTIFSAGEAKAYRVE